MKRVWAVLLAFLTASLTFASIFMVPQAAGATTPQENTWQAMASMFTARSGLGVAAVDGKIYAIGGRGSGSNLIGVNEMYNPKTNTWTTKAPMPEPKVYFGIAVYGDAIYCLGGIDEDKDYGAFSSGANFVYHTKTNSWTSIAPLPTPVWAVCANVVDGKIYVIGGEPNYLSNVAGLYTINTTQVYDIATDTWTTKTPIPTPVQYYTSAVIEGKICIIGGIITGTVSKNMQIYDPANDSWSSAPCQWHQGAGVALTSGVYAPQKLYEIGGYDGIFSNNWNTVFDPKTGNWSDGAALPTSRGGLGVAVVDDIIYAIGGTGRDQNKPPVDVVESYIPFGYSSTPLPTPTPIPTLSPTPSVSSTQPSAPVNSPIIILAATGVAAGFAVAVAGVLIYRYRRGLAGKTGQAVKQNK